MRCLIVGWVLLAACDGETTPPAAKAGAKYVVTKETVFYDSGCDQERKADGKLNKKTTFTLVKAEEGCWNVKLDSEDEVYIVPNRVTPAG